MVSSISKSSKELLEAEFYLYCRLTKSFLFVLYVENKTSNHQCGQIWITTLVYYTNFHWSENYQPCVDMYNPVLSLRIFILLVSLESQNLLATYTAVKPILYLSKKVSTYP